MKKTKIDLRWLIAFVLSGGLFPFVKDYIAGSDNPPDIIGSLVGIVLAAAAFLKNPARADDSDEDDEE